MKKLCSALILSLIFCSQTVFSCTIVIPSFRKTYRESKSVFIGEVLKIEEYYDVAGKERQISEDWLETNDILKKASPQFKGLFSKVTFEIKNRWKGNLSKQEDFIAVAFYDCGCPDNGVDRFEIGKEYLVMASGKNFAAICDSKVADSDWAKTDIKRLNKFWFRVWATIYPF